MTDILSHTEAGVLTLTFNRLARKNSITGAMYDALSDALAAAVDDAAVRAVLIQGDPTVFSAGNDIADFMAAAGTPADQPLPESPAMRFLRLIAAFPKPVVAAVCGPAVGIGTTLLFHCDLVYAGDNAAFSMPFVNLGLVPEAGSSLLAPLMFGYHRAAEALMLGEPFMAEAAMEVGLVNRVVPPTECNGIAQSQARKLAAKPLSALVETKRLLKLSQQGAALERLDVEGASFGKAMRSPAAREAFQAFMEKRKPDFSKV
ncbi:enoyl-CoA hydratase [Variovorax ginsengisoli]|uniref:Enoyl-CoA hydratase/carnithine racemase n=1 Tax=Variovorax ginsengisoli TaxID=363844 RepID=A0ABT9SBM2_9BURK|nr:enoyl-CoA hydratase [Variovorax ginsengisoli]MDP9901610.1 enoyl-CoA hydratase/carnithine racemase [Variovorax ginsengisoli]